MDNQVLEKERFAAWKRNVNHLVEATTGLSCDDLPDMPYRDWFDDNVSSARAAMRVIREWRKEL